MRRKRTRIKSLVRTALGSGALAFAMLSSAQAQPRIVDYPGQNKEPPSRSIGKSEEPVTLQDLMKKDRVLDAKVKEFSLVLQRTIAHVQKWEDALHNTYSSGEYRVAFRDQKSGSWIQRILNMKGGEVTPIEESVDELEAMMGGPEVKKNKEEILSALSQDLLDLVKTRTQLTHIGSKDLEDRGFKRENLEAIASQSKHLELSLAGMIQRISTTWAQKYVPLRERADRLMGTGGKENMAKARKIGRALGELKRRARVAEEIINKLEVEKLHLEREVTEKTWSRGNKFSAKQMLKKITGSIF